MGEIASQITSLTIVYPTVFFWCRSKKTSQLRVTGLCVGNSPVTGEFPAQRASNAENVSIWWRHHEDMSHQRSWPTLVPVVHCPLRLLSINSLAPGRYQCDSKNDQSVFNLALLIAIFKSSYDNVLRWMPQDLTDYKSTLVQVMAWCRQATNHYLNQCWPRSPTPYGVTRPHWVNWSNVDSSSLRYSSSRLR